MRALACLAVLWLGCNNSGAGLGDVGAVTTDAGATDTAAEAAADGAPADAIVLDGAPSLDAPKDSAPADTSTQETGTGTDAKADAQTCTETWLPEITGLESGSGLCGYLGVDYQWVPMWRRDVCNSMYWSDGQGARCVTCRKGGSQLTGYRVHYDYGSDAQHPDGFAFDAICVASCGECAY